MVNVDDNRVAWVRQKVPSNQGEKKKCDNQFLKQICTFCSTLHWDLELEDLTWLVPTPSYVASLVLSFLI